MVDRWGVHQASVVAVRIHGTLIGRLELGREAARRYFLPGGRANVLQPTISAEVDALFSRIFIVRGGGGAGGGGGCDISLIPQPDVEQGRLPTVQAVGQRIDMLAKTALKAGGTVSRQFRQDTQDALRDERLGLLLSGTEEVIRHGKISKCMGGRGNSDKGAFITSHLVSVPPGRML